MAQRILTPDGEIEERGSAPPQGERAKPSAKKASAKRSRAEKVSAPESPPDSAPGTPPPPRRRFLARVGSAALYISNTDRPWELPIDSLVIPTQPDPEPFSSGQVASAVREVLPSSTWEQVQSQVFNPSVILSADGPVFIDLDSPPPGFHPRTLIVATSWIGGEDAQGQMGRWPVVDPAPSVDGAGRATRAVVREAARRSLRCPAIPLLGAGSGKLQPVAVAKAVIAAIESSQPRSPLQEITILTLETEAYDEAVALFTRVPQRFSNDLASGEDLLEVASEVQALTDVLLLRSMEPPLAVGILGGWGTGKSFVMDLMLRHIQRIRSLPVDPASAWSDDGPAGQYVGHVYPIRFDAWTYAKSNLWASLMQTIFLGLSRQVHLERKIRERLEKDGKNTPELECRLWLAFQTVDVEDRDALLGSDGLSQVFSELAQPAQQLESEPGRLLWETVAQLKEQQQVILKAKQAELAEVSAQIEEKKAGIAGDIDREIEKQAYRLAWSEVSPALKDVIEDVVRHTPGGEDLIKKGESLGKFLTLVGRDITAVPMRIRDYRKMLARNPVAVWGALLAIAALGGLGVLLAKNDEFVAAAVAWLGSVATPLVGIAQLARAWRDRLVRSWQGFEKQTQAIEERMSAEREARLRQRLAEPEIVAGLKKQEERQRQLEAEIQRLRLEIGFTADYVTIADLVDDRLRQAQYEGELGLMHRIQSDLAELSRSLSLPPKHPHLAKLKEQFPRGHARIILFIDDLDRCPPDRVVEVLETVQLLVKTPLFVVVLAMDVRYITRALEKVYKDILLRDGSPSGLDYIEKIIQLPYSVRPVDATQIERYLRGQMVVEESLAPVSLPATPAAHASGGASGGAGGSRESSEEPEPVTAEMVVFTAQELGWVTRSCRRLPLSPRSIKRVVNALKLLKIVWFRPNRHIRPAPEVQESFVALLVLSAAHPNGMRHLFAELSDRLLEERNLIPLRGTLKSLLDSPGPRCSPEERKDLEKSLDLIPEQAKVGPDLRATLELVRSLSFVAEIGQDPVRS